VAILAQDITDAEQARLIAFWGSLPAWRKLEIIGDLYEAAENLALADLRRQHPGETPEQLYARLIERRKLVEQHHHAA
jgi:hypothetical protein